MKHKSMFNYTKDREWYVNCLWCLFGLVGILLLPTLFALVLKDVIKNTYVCSILGEILFIIILVLIYFKDLCKEFNTFINKFRNNFGICFRYYITGLLLMFTFNLIIVSFVKDIALNETQVRELLFSHTSYMLFSIVVLAPITEELVFRKSISTIIKNKWLYAIISGLLFGGAHIMTNILGGTFSLTDLLFIIPYGSFGFMFALMDNKTNTTFSSIMMHSIHNLLNGMLLLQLHFLGVL